MEADGEEVLSTAIQDGASFRFFGRRNLVALAVCAAAAGPAALIAVLVWAAVSYPNFPTPASFGMKDMVGIAMVIGLSSAYGLVGGLPAAILNSILHLALVKRGIDGRLVSAISGSFFGAVFDYLVVGTVSYDPIKLEIMYPLASAGALIGLLYRLLFIRHYRCAKSR